jgi:lycopene cyclase domain-containing protein
LSYATFLLIFILPPVLILALLQKRGPLLPFGHGPARAISATCLVALAYTTPWDNYLVYRGVWGYGSGQILGTIGYVPVEEYAFMILQPVMTGLFLCILLGTRKRELYAGGRDSQRVRRGVAAVYGALTVVGAGLLASGWERGLYLGLILAWAGPVLLGMWVYAAGVYLRVRIPFVLASTIPTLYLWVTDRFAIANGAWEISDRYTVGLSPLGLPVEEAIFFLLTNLLVVQGVLLFMNGPVERPAGVRSVGRAPSATGQVHP